MNEVPLDPKLDPSKLDPSRGLEPDGTGWTLFGLSLEPDAWVDHPETAAVERLWNGSGKWSREDPGILHGLIVGARAAVRALVRRGVSVKHAAWADLGGSTGHYAIALALEGSVRVLLVDETDPGVTARRVLDALKIEVVVGDAYDEPLVGTHGVLALYSIDPLRVVHPQIDFVVVAPCGDAGNPYERDRASVVQEMGFGHRILSFSTPFLMGDGACRPGQSTTQKEVWTRKAKPQWAHEREGIQTLHAAVMSVFDRPRERAPSAPPRVPKREGYGSRTGSVPIDVGLAGLDHGRVHLVTSSDAAVRTAVLADLVRCWFGVEDSPMLFAGSGSEREVVASVTASVTGIRRDAILAGAFESFSYRERLEEWGDLHIRFADDIRTAKDFDRCDVGPVGAVAVDLEEFDASELELWQRIARRIGVPIVLGVSSSSPALKGHVLPELRLTRLAIGAARLRLACRGVRVDGALSRRILVDVDRATLALSAYDPTHEREGGEVPADPTLQPLSEESWATSDDGGAR